MQTTEKLVDDVGTILLSNMVVDQEPYQIKTESLSIQLNRQSPTSLGTNLAVSNDEAAFKLSFDAITDEKAKGAQFIDTLVRIG